MYQNRNISNTDDNQRFTKPCFRFGNGAFRRAAADFSRKVWESAELEAQKNRISVLFFTILYCVNCFFRRPMSRRFCHTVTITIVSPSMKYTILFSLVVIER